MVEHSAVNGKVVGSSPTFGANLDLWQNGDAKDFESFYSGSIPDRSSISINNIVLCSLRYSQVVRR